MSLRTASKVLVNRFESKSSFYCTASTESLIYFSVTDSYVPCRHLIKSSYHCECSWQLFLDGLLMSYSILNPDALIANVFCACVTAIVFTHSLEWCKSPARDQTSITTQEHWKSVLFSKSRSRDWVCKRFSSWRMLHNIIYLMKSYWHQSWRV